MQIQAEIGSDYLAVRHLLCMGPVNFKGDLCILFLSFSFVGRSVIKEIFRVYSIRSSSTSEHLKVKDHKLKMDVQLQS